MLNKQFSIDTKLPADCVSLLPIHKQGDNNKFLFVCATYNLDDGLIQKKSGGIVMGTVTVNQSKTEDHLPQVCLKDVQHIPLSFGGILDLKWNDSTSWMSRIFAATSSGHIISFPLDYSSSKDIILYQISQDNSSMALSLDLHANGSMIASSYDNGYLKVIDTQYSNNRDMIWQGHTEAAWTCYFDKEDYNMLYSGGDDGQLKIWDLRSLDNVASVCHPSRLGITSIDQSSLLLASGGYDQHIYLWDKRKMSSYLKCITNIPMGGGVWRLKWSLSDDTCHYNNDLLLNACMQGGFSIIKVHSNDVINGDILEHNNLNGTASKGIVYGVDWIPFSSKSSDNNVSFIIATCTFYTHELAFYTYHNQNLGNK